MNTFALLEKDAATRRKFLSDLMGIVGASAAGSTAGVAYKGLRNLTKDFSHEIGRAGNVRATSLSPAGSKAVGLSDLKAWSTAREPSLQEASSLKKRFGSKSNEIVKALEDSGDAAGYRAMSSPSQKATKSRYLKAEGVEGAAKGGVAGGLLYTLKRAIQQAMEMKKSSSTEQPAPPAEASPSAETEVDYRRQRDEKALRNRHIALALRRAIQLGLLGAGVGGMGAAGAEGGMDGAEGAVTGGLVGALLGGGFGAAEGGAKRLLGMDPIMDTTLIAHRA